MRPSRRPALAALIAHMKICDQTENSRASIEISLLSPSVAADTSRSSNGSVDRFLRLAGSVLQSASSLQPGGGGLIKQANPWVSFSIHSAKAQRSESSRSA